MRKPSLRVVQAEEGGWRQSGDDEESLKIENILESIPTTGLVSGGEWTGVPFKTLLELAGIQEGAVSVALHGWDEGRPDPVTNTSQPDALTSMWLTPVSSIMQRRCR